MKPTRSTLRRPVAAATLSLVAVLWLASRMAGSATFAAPDEPAAQDGLITGTVAVPAAADNTLYESPQGTLSNGAGDHFFAGQTNNGDLRRGLVRFDLSPLPTWTSVISASLVLQATTPLPVSTSVISVHPTSAGWGEGASDAPGEEGAGTAAQPGDATWLHTSFPSANWTTPGGDFDPAASAATIVAGNGAYSWSSPGLVADVQDWVSDPATNFGWLIAGDESSLHSAKRFDSRENDNPANVPRLLVTFSVVLEQIALPVILK